MFIINIYSNKYYWTLGPEDCRNFGKQIFWYVQKQTNCKLNKFVSQAWKIIFKIYSWKGWKIEIFKTCIVRTYSFRHGCNTPFGLGAQIFLAVAFLNVLKWSCYMLKLNIMLLVVYPPTWPSPSYSLSPWWFPKWNRSNDGFDISFQRSISRKWDNLRMIKLHWQQITNWFDKLLNLFPNRRETQKGWNILLWYSGVE